MQAPYPVVLFELFEESILIRLYGPQTPSLSFEVFLKVLNDLAAVPRAAAAQPGRQCTDNHAAVRRHGGQGQFRRRAQAISRRTRQAALRPASAACRPRSSST
jgi:hypothetical protein